MDFQFCSGNDYGMHLHEQPELDTKSILERKMEKKKKNIKKKKKDRVGFSGLFWSIFKRHEILHHTCFAKGQFKLETCVCKTLCTQLYAYH